MFLKRDVAFTLDHTRAQPFLLAVTRLVIELVVALHTTSRLVTFENYISSLAQLRVS